jgi:dTDP-glucose 4,6-dehydratase
MKTILITGGAGFIGSNFILHMLDKHPSYKIINFDALTYAANLNNLSSVKDHSQYKFVQGDITDKNAVQKIIPKANIIIHFAAETHVDRSIDNPEIFTCTNILGTQILLDESLKNNIERFIHISTDEVYGSLSSPGKFTENTDLRPNSPYAASKAGSDLLCRSYFETFDFPVIVTRSSNNYGPFQFLEKFIPQVITNAKNDEKIPIYGDGSNIRDWIHVSDNCEAIVAVLEKGKVGEIYNIGANNEWVNLTIAKLILKHLTKPESLLQFTKDRLGHDQRYAINASKIQKELAWHPSIKFDKGLIQTIQWYLDQ